MLAWRCGCVAMNGGFCQPSPCCVHLHTAHCGRSISGASARGSFARSAWCVVGFASVSLLTALSPHESGGGLRSSNCQSAAAAFTQNGISSSISSASSLSLAGGCVGGLAAAGAVRLLLTLAVSSGLLRRRDAHPQGRAHLAAEFSHRWKHDDDLAGPAFEASPKAPRMVRLLTRLSTRPRSSLVNQTTSFFSLSAPIPIDSSVTVFDAEFLLLREISRLEVARLVVG